MEKYLKYKQKYLTKKYSNNRGGAVAAIPESVDQPLNGRDSILSSYFAQEIVDRRINYQIRDNTILFILTGDSARFYPPQTLQIANDSFHIIDGTIDGNSSVQSFYEPKEAKHCIQAEWDSTDNTAMYRGVTLRQLLTTLGNQRQEDYARIDDTRFLVQLRN